MNATKLILSAFLFSLGSVASADIMVRFFEGAPKDRFSFTNKGACAQTNLVVTLDLSESKGRLIFDTTGEGAGVEVYQPFEVREGDIKLVSQAEVKDGESTLTIQIGELQPNQSAGFTIDVDDTLTQSELGMIRVSHSEISGGEVSIASASGETASARFGSAGALILAWQHCP